jgi:hypothetical protein
MPNNLGAASNYLHKKNILKEFIHMSKMRGEGRGE